MECNNKRIDKLKEILKELHTICGGNLGQGPFHVIADIINIPLENKLNPDLIDKYMQIALDCREVLGFSKYEEVSPKDLKLRISEMYAEGLNNV